MSYPIEKYKFYTNGKKIIAVTTFAGHTVRGVATCSDSDEFSTETGKRIAAARCNLKVCQKRKQRAASKMCDARREFENKLSYHTKMCSYYADASVAYDDAARELDELLENFTN